MVGEEGIWRSDEAKKHSPPGRDRIDGRIAAVARGQTDGQRWAEGGVR